MALIFSLSIIVQWVSFSLDHSNDQQKTQFQLAVRQNKFHHPEILYSFLFYKNHFYKNVEAEICPQI